MPAWIPILASLFGFLLIVLMVVLLRVTLQLKNSLEAQDKLIAKQNQRITQLEQQIKSLNTRLETERNDPLGEVVKLAIGWRGSGVVQTLGMIGVKLFQSYWKGRSHKALPNLKDK